MSSPRTYPHPYNKPRHTNTSWETNAHRLPISAATTSVSNFQGWNGQYTVPSLHWGFTVHDERGNARPNCKYYDDLKNAIRFSETIDAFDRDLRLIHELVFRIPDPDLGHPSMNEIRDNHCLVKIFLYSH
ncbi:hypothetical protein J1614_011018 [Plenodomus biglobosus]|nr:hypothetical protein J1614_011018 [Plenodomus biglobosus]